MVIIPFGYAPRYGKGAAGSCRDLDLESGALAWRAVQGEAAAEDFDPVFEADQAGALGEIGAAAPVVMDADAQCALVDGYLDGGGGGPGVPGGVGQRLGDDVVDGDLRWAGQLAGDLDIQVHRHRAVAGQRLQRRPQPALGEHRGVDAP